MEAGPITGQQTAAWDAFVEDSPQGSLFATSVWGRILERAFGHPFRIIAVTGSGKIIGGTAFIEKRQLGARCALHPLATPHIGFLLERPSGEKLSDATSNAHQALKTMASCLEKNYSHIQLVCAPELEDVRPLLQSGWIAEPRYSYRLDLTDTEALWNRFDGNVRQAIRKAEKAGYTPDTGVYTPDEVSALVNNTMNRRGAVNPIPAKYFQEILGENALEGRRLITGARTPEGRLAGVVGAVWDRHRAYYLIASTSPETLSAGVNSLLIWHLIQQLAQRGIGELDFMGGNIPGVARFKEGFNPRLVAGFRVERWTSTWFRLIKTLSKKMLGRE